MARLSLENASTITNKAKPTSRKRKSISTTDRDTSAKAIPAASSPRATKRPRLSTAITSKATATTALTTTSNTVADLEEDTTNSNAYSTIHTTTKSIPQSTIEQKWLPLPSILQDKIKDLFSAIERPVLTRFGYGGNGTGAVGAAAGGKKTALVPGGAENERRRAEAQAATSAVVRRLSRKVPQMRFPADASSAGVRKKGNVQGKGAEWMWDLESVMGRYRELEGRLGTGLHSVKVLRAEVRREEALLEKERKELAELEKNARAMEKRRVKAGAKRHAILNEIDFPTRPKDTEPTDADGQRFLEAKSTPDEKEQDEDLDLESLLDDDDEIAPLLTQLRSHLDSMRGNSAQIEGLVPALREARVGLEVLAWKKMEGEEYEMVFLRD